MSRSGFIILVVFALIVFGVGIYMLVGKTSVGFDFTTSQPGNNTMTVTATVTEPGNTTTITVTTTRIITYTPTRPPGSVGWVNVEVLDEDQEPLKGVFLSILDIFPVAKYINITVYEPKHTSCHVLITYIVTYTSATVTARPFSIYDPFTKMYVDSLFGSNEISKLKNINDIVGWKGEGYYTIYIGVKLEYPDGTTLESTRWAVLSGYWDGSKYHFADLNIIDTLPVVGGH